MELGYLAGALLSPRVTRSPIPRSPCPSARPTDPRPRGPWTRPSSIARVPSVADLAEELFVSGASGDVAARGRELAPLVELDRFGPIEVVAWVPDLARHRVVMRAARDGLD